MNVRDLLQSQASPRPSNQGTQIRPSPPSPEQVRTGQYQQAPQFTNPAPPVPVHTEPESYSVEAQSPANTRRINFTGSKVLVHENRTGPYAGRKFWRFKTPISSTEDANESTYGFLIETSPMNNRYRANYIVVVQVGEDLSDHAVPIGFFWERTVQKPERRGSKFWAGRILHAFSSCTALMNVFKGPDGTLVGYIKVSYDPSQDPRLAGQMGLDQVQPANMEFEHYDQSVGQMVVSTEEEIPF